MSQLLFGNYLLNTMQEMFSSGPAERLNLTTIRSIFLLQYCRSIVRGPQSSQTHCRLSFQIGFISIVSCFLLKLADLRRINSLKLHRSYCLASIPLSSKATIIWLVKVARFPFSNMCITLKTESGTH